MKSIINEEISPMILPKTISGAHNNLLIEIADKIIENYFYENNSFEYVFMGEKYDNWDYVHEKSSNTYQLYIHSLGVISYLTDAFLKSNEKKYLKYAYKIILSWKKYNDNIFAKKTKQVWSDHAISSRVINILYFYLIACKNIKINKKMFSNLIIMHLDELEKCKYQLNNHGLMIDRTLIILSFFLKNKNISEKIYNKGFYRMNAAFYRDFSKKGVHLENSVDYHNFTKKIIKETRELLKEFSKSFDKEINDFLEKDDFFSYIMKPNKYLPMIGDSTKNYVKDKIKKFNNFFDFTAGIVLFQNQENNLYLLFNCGYAKNNHKHFDDLSINLYYDTEDIFIDSGKYNYDYSSVTRNYIISTSAHNTISIGTNYELLEDWDKYEKRSHITSYQSNFAYDITSGINYYHDGEHKRTVIYIKPNYVLLIDEIKHENSYNIIQNFNINPKLISEKNNKSILIKNNDNLIAKITQIEECDNFIIKKGNQKESFGVISETFGSIIEIEQIHSIINAKEARYITLISLGEENPEKEPKKIKINEKERFVSFNYNGKIYKIYI